MDQMRVVAGVDGGGTRTRAALVDESGRVLGLGEAGPSNYGDVGLAGTQDPLVKSQVSDDGGRRAGHVWESQR